MSEYLGLIPLAIVALSAAAAMLARSPTATLRSHWDNMPAIVWRTERINGGCI